MSDEQRSKEARAEGVRRQLNGEEPPEDTDRLGEVGPTGGGDGEMAPEGVGVSRTRRGERVSTEDGKEAGRVDTGTDDAENGRPTGESTARDLTGVDPQEGPDT